MRRDVLTGLRILAFPTLGFLVVVAFAPGRAGLAVRIYMLIVAAVVVGYAVEALRRTYPRASALRRPPSRAAARRRPPSSLARIEHEAALGVAGAFDLHHRLRPRLRSIASGLLETRRRISLDDEPDAARRALGDEAWALVRPNRPPPADRLARGLAVSELRAVVEGLERT